MKILIAVAIAVSMGFGGWVGWQVQKGRQVDEAERRLQAAQEMHAANLLAQHAEAEARIEQYRDDIRRANEQIIRNELIVSQERERAAELRNRMAALRGRLSDGSACDLDPADVGVLNEAVEAVRSYRADAH